MTELPRHEVEIDPIRRGQQKYARARKRAACQQRRRRRRQRSNESRMAANETPMSEECKFVH